MKVVYRLNRRDSISFERSQISSLTVGHRVSQLHLESIKVETRGNRLSEKNIHQRTVESFNRFFAEYREALRRLS